MRKTVLRGFLIKERDGTLLGTVNSWYSGFPQPFKTKSAAEKYSYLGKVVAVQLTIEPL